MESLIPTVNTLEEIYMIAGSKHTLYYDIYDENDAPMDMSGASIELRICEFGRPSNVTLIKSGEYIGSPINRFCVELDSEDTVHLSGKYIQQPIIIDYLEQEYLPAQGYITIAPRIHSEETIGFVSGDIIVIN